MTKIGRESEEFTVEHGGKIYPCIRVIRGTRVLTQEITVFGVGSKHDSANYGQKHRPIQTMESIARIIAFEILANPKHP